LILVCEVHTAKSISLGYH